MSKRKSDEIAATIESLLYAAVLNNGKYSDLTINCKGRVFKLHKFSCLFEIKAFCCNSRWCLQEATTGVIELKENDPNITEKVISFLYTSNYSDRRGTLAEKRSIAAAAVNGSHFPNFWAEFSEQDKLIINRRRNGFVWANIELEWQKITMCKLGTDILRKRFAKFLPLSTSNPLIANTEVYIAADMWEISKLKELAAKNFGEVLEVASEDNVSGFVTP